MLTAIAFLPSVTRGEERDVAASHRSRGQEIVRQGEMIRLEGVLHGRNGEWFLRAAGKDYRLYPGTAEQREKIGLNLETGKRVVVNGFIHEQEVAVSTILIDDRLHLIFLWFEMP